MPLVLWSIVFRRRRERDRELTIPHSHSQRGVVKLDIVDSQHVHEELQPKSAYDMNGTNGLETRIQVMG